MKLLKKYDTPKNQIRKYRVKKRSLDISAMLFRHLILISIGYIILYPLMYMITTSIRQPSSYFDPSIVWITEKVTLDNFKNAISLINYWGALKNTVVYEIIASFIQLLVCAVIAYGLARFEFKEKKLLNVILILTILLPVQMTILPTFTNYAHMDILGILGVFNKLTGVDLRVNVLDTPLVFYLPAMFGVGLRSGIIIFIYIQFFKSFPYELEEASWLDGCGPWRTFFSIIIPSSTVVIFTNVVFSTIWHWNDYYLAGMYIKDIEKLTLGVQIANAESKIFAGTSGTGATSLGKAPTLMAACLLFVLPMLIIYLIIQKKFVKSIDRVGITG